MKLGSPATIGAQASANLVHVVLDNGARDSTGGQPTVSASVDFAGVALACGYASGSLCDDLPGFEALFRTGPAEPWPHLVHARISPGSMARLGRPTVHPSEVTRRFQLFLMR